MLDIHSVMDQISEAFFALDTELRFTYLNSRASELLHRDVKGLIGQCLFDEFPSATDTLFEQQYRRAMETKQDVQFEEYYAPLDKWFKVRAYPSERGLHVYFKDISTRKLLEQEIEQQRYLLIHAEEIAEIRTWEWNMQRNTVSWSDGRVYKDIASNWGDSFRSFLQVVHPEDRDFVKDAFCKAQTGQPYDVVYRSVQTDGEYRACHTHGAIFYDGGNHPVKMVGVTHDITERVEEGKRLAESEERYRTLVENALNSIAVHDGGRWMFMNQSGLKMLGLSRLDEIIGKPLYDFLHPDYHALSKARSNLIIREQKALEVTEVTWLSRHGELIETEVLAMPVTFEGKTAVQLIIRDVSARKQTEKLLVQSEKLAAIGQLAAGVAHEVRNPLTSLKGFLQLLRADSKDSKQAYFAIMEQELNRIEMISNEMLMLAKPQAMSFEVQDILPIVSSVVTLLEPQATMNNVAIVTSYTDVAPISCVNSAVKQVFVNLIKNAIEAMPYGGQIKVSVTEAHRRVKVQVEDNGSGMPKDLLPRLGEPFLTTKRSGTGLGLMITYKIIEDHNGTITFHSKEGSGTKVEVTFPVFSSHRPAK